VTLKEVSSVIDDINEWENPRGGSVFYVTAIFTDESVGSAGRKDHDAALEVQGLLREAIGQELDFTLEPKGQTKSGREKFNIKGFGTPGGAATYTAPGVQGAATSQEGTTVPAGVRAVSSRPRSPEPSGEQAFRTPADFRAEKALEAAVDAVRPSSHAPAARQGDINAILEYADAFNAWMLEKTSEPSSAYRQVEDDSPSDTPAGGSESSDSARASEPTLIGAESESAGSQGSPEGEAGDPVPHTHDWQAHPNLHGWLSCECGENRKKYAP
jgi:hypothetical protein